MSLRPIKTDVDYQQALAEIEALFEAQPNTLEGDRLDVLTTLVEAYEQKHHPVLPPDPIEALLYHLESRGLTRRDLEPYLGSRARVAEVLNRRRALTMGMIRRLHQGLGLPAEVLIQPYPLSRPSAQQTFAADKPHGQPYGARR
jgi:HTH-type transcriptional regulator/antitoxin HigA